MERTIRKEKKVTGLNIGKHRKGNIYSKFTMNYDLYIMFLPVLAYFIIFCYGPLYGLQIAFKEFNPSLGIFRSPWVGFDFFQRFFNSYNFFSLIKNTLGISIYQLVLGFPAPIILALMLNSVNNRIFKKTVQTVTYAPYFISVVVMAGMIVLFLSPSSGIVNIIYKSVGGTPVDFMGKPEMFKTIYVLSEIWQNTGFGSVIYIAVLTGIDPQLHESAIIDGASKLKRIWYIDLPGISPTIIILLILNMGKIMNVGFEKVLLLQNPLNLESSDIISTYVYTLGIQQAQYSFAAAVGLFNNVINFIILICVNQIAKRVSEMSLF